MGLLGSLVYFGAGGNAYADAQFTPHDLQDKLSTITTLEPPYGATKSGGKYSMKFVTPAPGIEFEIVEITPNPDIAYKIRITGPNSQKPFMGTGSRRGEITRQNPWKK